MSIQLDFNEYLFLNKIQSTLNIENTKALELHRLFPMLQVDESFFLQSLKQMEKRRLLKIGFYKRGSLLAVFNWSEKYTPESGFYVTLTKQGVEALSRW